jgi:hypothetical protein
MFNPLRGLGVTLAVVSGSADSSNTILLAHSILEPTCSSTLSLTRTKLSRIDGMAELLNPLRLMVNGPPRFASLVTPLARHLGEALAPSEQCADAALFIVVNVIVQIASKLTARLGGALSRMPGLTSTT